MNFLKTHKNSIGIIITCIFFTGCCNNDDAVEMPEPDNTVITVSTFTGNRFAEGCNAVDGPSNTAEFCTPWALTHDASGFMYMTEVGSHKIREIAPNGDVTTIAGSSIGFSDGLELEARFHFPSDIVVNFVGNTLEIFVADRQNYRIRKVASGFVDTMTGSTDGDVDGIFADARFREPTGVVMDNSGNLYVTDLFKIRKIAPSGNVTTLAGSSLSGFVDGTGTIARFDFLSEIEIAEDGNIYVIDGGRSIRKITPQGQVTTIAGSLTRGYVDGEGLSARFQNLMDITSDGMGHLYAAENDPFTGTIKIRKISLEGDVSTSLATAEEGYEDGEADIAKFGIIRAISYYDKNLYVTDTRYNNIRKISIPE